MGAVEGSLWPTTGDINNESQSLAASIQQVGRDIFNSSVSGDSDAYATFQNSWNTFVQDFDAWKDASWFWNPTRRDELIEYRGRYNALLSQMRALGISSLAADQKTSAPNPLDTALSVLNKLIIGGAVLGVAYIGYRVWEKTRP
jgi:heme oxygenase